MFRLSAVTNATAVTAMTAVTTLLLAAAVCRFTVRDVGFVDLGDPAYMLYAFVSKTESPAAYDGIQRLTTALFAETNVEVERVDPDSEQRNGPERDAQRLLRALKIQEFPTTVLVHPDGHAIEVPFGGKFDQNGGRVLESVFLSPTRRRILDGVLRRYCIVLLAEGSDPTVNARVKRAVEAAFAGIEHVFDKMPKPVGDLPELIVLPYAGRADEAILLWSLGLGRGRETERSEGEQAETVEPSVAVLFGRGRRIGPILDGAAITEASVLGILANAGQSCECDLDRSWMRGPRIPLRWDAKVKQQAVAALGFDPENPLVKAEISGILARGPKGDGDRFKEPTVADLLGAYAEESVDTDASAGAAPGSQPDSPSGSQARPAAADPESAPHATTDAGITWRTLTWTLAGLIGLSGVAALFILSRARRS